MELPPLVPSPDSWLRGAIDRHRPRQSALARLLGVDEPRFSRYAGGREQIPRPHLSRLALELDPEAYDYVLCLKDCEDLADDLGRRVAEFTAGVQATPAVGRQSKREWGEVVRAAANAPLAGLLTNALLAAGRTVLTQQGLRSPGAVARAWRRHLADAARAVDLVRRPVETAYSKPLLPPEAVPGFRYPVNHFAGVLLDLDTAVAAGAPDAAAVTRFRARMLARMRRVVWAGDVGSRPLDILSRQFTTHLLSRHGEADDRDRVREFLQHGARTAEPLLRRLSFTGLVLGGRDTDTADRFLWSLQRDRTLAAANLFFNAFHYGDLVLRSDRSLPREVSRFHRSVPHILRHLEHPNAYRSIVETECVTLLHALHAGGPGPLLRPATLARLRALLRNDGALASVRPSVRRAFVRAVRPLVVRGP